MTTVKEKINFRLINYIILTAIIVMAFFIRFNNLEKHFSHVDDLIAPAVATEGKLEIVEKINKKFNLSKEGNEKLLAIYPYLEPLIIAIKVAKASTYAPLQFLITGAIVEKNMSYHEILFNSRIISLLMGFLSIIVIVYIYLKLYGKDNVAYAIFGVVILSFSWEHIIYSMQSESYAIGLFVVLMSFIVYSIYFSKKNISKKESLFLGVILSLFIFANYQFLFFIPGFYLAILISYKSEYRKFFSSYLLSLLLLGLSTLLLYKVFLSSLVSRGINWNAGLNKEFLFDLSVQNNFFESIGYIFSFFIQNTYYVFRNLISFASEGSLYNDAFAIIYIVLFFIGLFSFYNSKNMLKKHFVYFFLTTVVIWVLLVVMQKITLSPTRHSLVLLSFTLIFTPAGLIYIIKKYKMNKNTIVVFSMIVVLLFSLNYSAVINQRLDKFNPTQIEELVKKYNITEIYAYGWTWNLNFMRYINDHFNKTITPAGDVYLYNKSMQNNNTLFITHRKRVLNEEIKKRFLKISERPLNSSMSLLYKQESKSETEICFGDETKNGTNSLFIYIVHIEGE